MEVKYFSLTEPSIVQVFAFFYTLRYKIKIDYSFSDKAVLITCVLNSLKLSRVNIYASNSQSERLEFLQNLNNCLIDKSKISTLIVGGDWNCTLSKMEKTGGTIWKPTNYRNLILTTRDAFDLVDIQRLRHPRQQNSLMNQNH